MFKNRLSVGIVFAGVLAACVLLPATASAQTATAPSSGQPLPRNNVSAAAVAARRPGLWVQSGVATHNKRQDASLQSFGGVTISQKGPTPSFKDKVLPEIVKILMDTFSTFATLLSGLFPQAT